MSIFAFKFDWSISAQARHGHRRLELTKIERQLVADFEACLSRRSQSRRDLPQLSIAIVNRSTQA
jgi:hypothetical protein